jgi:hypothetical protein
VSLSFNEFGSSTTWNKELNKKTYQEQIMKKTNQSKNRRARKADNEVEDKRAAMLLERIQNDPVERDRMIYHLAMNLQSEETAKR